MSIWYLYHWMIRSQEQTHNDVFQCEKTLVFVKGAFCQAFFHSSVRHSLAFSLFSFFFFRRSLRMQQETFKPHKAPPILCLHSTKQKHSIFSLSLSLSLSLNLVQPKKTFEYFMMSISILQCITLVAYRNIPHILSCLQR